MATAAPPRRPSRKQAEPQNDDGFQDTLTELERYQSVFGEITRFVDVIRQGEKELEEAKLELAQAKAAMEAAKDRVTEINDYREAAKHGLLRYLDRGKEILPLFDQMDPSDDEVHGEHATEWRSEPVTALKLAGRAEAERSEPTDTSGAFARSMHKHSTGRNSTQVHIANFGPSQEGI